LSVRRVATRCVPALLVLAGAVDLGVFSWPGFSRAEGAPLDSAQKSDGRPSEPEFARLAKQLAQQRLSGAEESETSQEQALAILDRIVLEALNGRGQLDLEGLNERLAALVTQQPAVGEGYQVKRLGGTPAVYALVVNFGLSGPSAARFYSAAPGRYALVARVDRFAQKDFFDEYLELIPVPAPVIVFVTVTGRTDDLQTGEFTAWRLEGERLTAIWFSDILQQSTYELRPDGFLLTYCAETDEENPRLCRRMERGRFVWEAGSWKRVERADLPVPKR
jgi:hypothetical protein